jgi:hypothetical protein
MIEPIYMVAQVSQGKIGSVVGQLELRDNDR